MEDGCAVACKVCAVSTAPYGRAWDPSKRTCTPVPPPPPPPPPPCARSADCKKVSDSCVGIILGAAFSSGSSPESCPDDCQDAVDCQFDECGTPCGKFCQAGHDLKEPCKEPDRFRHWTLIIVIIFVLLVGGGGGVGVMAFKKLGPFAEKGNEPCKLSPPTKG